MLAVLETLLYIALVLIVLALIIDLVVVTSQTRVSKMASTAVKPKVAVAVGAGAGGAADVTLDEGDDPAPAPEPVLTSTSQSSTAKAASTTSTLSVGSLSTGMTVIAWLLLTVYIVGRAIVTGRSPLTNMHEYGVALVWAFLLASLIAFWRFKARILSVGGEAVAALMLVFALSVSNAVQPLVPALQNSALLTLHVGFAILASGAACVSFVAAVMYLLHPWVKLKVTPAALDDIAYKAAVVSYPLWTLMLLLGALWANVAWGKYWSWDPKETAALVTWLIYTAFLHARVVRGWRGNRSAWLLVIAFVAVLFTLFGNYFFGGLHSYAS